MVNLKQHTNIALGYFFMAALLGVFLRMFFVTSIPANFRYIVHTHSHIALLGWVYLGLTTLIYKFYFSGAGKGKIYKRIFWFTQITLLGMLFSFPFQGYALFSITFSTFFLIASYFLAWFFMKRVPEHFRKTNSFICIRASLWYLLISSIGPWAIGGVMATLGNTSIWYNLSIYFYLHFQYNGWFVLALCGIFLFFLEKKNLQLQKGDFKRFFWLLNWGIILTLFLSGLWVKPHWIFYALGGLGAALQLLAVIEFITIVKPHWKRDLLPFSPFFKAMLQFAFLLFVGKIVMQVVSAIPFFAELSFQLPDFIIGYLHWTFLGAVSISLFAFLKTAELLRFPKIVFWIYLPGFVLSEFLIFYKGTALWLGLPFFLDYFWILTLISALIPVAVGILLFNNFRKSDAEKAALPK